jgi:glycosyltransferase involved in cell wall biosynthesis
MAAGRPVICLDLGGPAMQVTEETGFRVAATSVATAMEGLTQAMRALAADPILHSRMSSASRKHVRSFSWEQRVGAIVGKYGTVTHAIRRFD